MESSMLVVLMTAPSEDVAVNVGRTLVEERLAACVNIVPGLRSIYAWRGKVEDEAEVLCLVKTRATLWDALRARVTALHPYEVPELVALSPTAVSPAYLAWLNAETSAR